MAPNLSGDPRGSILEPMGSRWVQKMDQNCKKITMPQNSNFRLPRGHHFLPNNGSYAYSAKSRWEPPRVHFGANGVPLGKKKMSQNRKKLPCPKIRIFPRGRPFFQKNGSNGYGTKSRWGPPREHLGANGVPLDPKNWSKPKKNTMPQNSNFRLLRGHRFFAKKWKLRLWRQIPVGTP